MLCTLRPCKHIETFFKNKNKLWYQYVCSYPITTVKNGALLFRNLQVFIVDTDDMILFSKKIYGTGTCTLRYCIN